MELNGGLFPGAFIGVAGVLYGLVLYGAGRLANWRRLLDPARWSLFLGTVVALILLWHIRGHPTRDLTFHLLGITTVTLMLGWSLAVLASGLALAVVSLNTGATWPSFAVNAWLVGVVPATLTQVLLVLIRSWLPKEFFIFVLGNGFLTAGLVGLITGYLTAGLLAWSGAYSFGQLQQTLIPFFPLMALPEAMVNGWVLTALVVMRPDWVESFDVRLYLQGK